MATRRSTGLARRKARLQAAQVALVIDRLRPMRNLGVEHSRRAGMAGRVVMRDVRRLSIPVSMTSTRYYAKRGRKRTSPRLWLAKFGSVQKARTLRVTEVLAQR